MRIILALVLSIGFLAGSVGAVSAGQKPETYTFFSCSVRYVTPNGDETILEPGVLRVVEATYNFNTDSWTHVRIDGGPRIKVDLVQHGPCL